MKIKDVQKTVYEVLKDMPNTRKDDNVLYVAVCEVLCPDALTHSLWEAMLNAKKYGLIPFESVRRARQKVQAEHPDLKDPETTRRRAIKQSEYYDFARS